VSESHVDLIFLMQLQTHSQLTHQKIY